MDVRVVESITTTGTLASPNAVLDPALEPVSLTYTEADECLTVVDYNVDYNLAVFPNQVGSWHKKVFLTYNSCNCGNNLVKETVVMESNPAIDVNQLPGYSNSNEWEYYPREWHAPSEILEMTNPLDYSTSPYDVREGFTVVRQFLTAEANLSPGDPAYTAFYRTPHLMNLIPGNIEGNRVYTDGWYTSYIAVVPAYETYQDAVSLGQIFYCTTVNEFYINITGNVLAPDVMNPDAHLPWIDTINWASNPTLTQWKDFMSANISGTLPNTNLYFIETQHLVTVDLTKAIRVELLKSCSCCEDSNFEVSKIHTYMKLVEKRMGAFVKFNEGLYHEAQCIVESARQVCYICLFHNHKNGCSTC